MKREHINLYELPHYPELVEAFSFDATTGEDADEQLSDLWYDCDHVKLDGESGRGNHMFVDYKGKDTHYIIHYDADDAEAIELINWWLDGAEGDLIGNVGSKGSLENTWQDWDKVKTGVAYRGGSGYCYGLYAKELI